MERLVILLNRFARSCSRDCHPIWHSIGYSIGYSIVGKYSIMNLLDHILVQSNAIDRRELEFLTAYVAQAEKVDSLVSNFEDEADDGVEWVVNKNGTGRATGGSADTPADTRAGASTARPEYIGFRVVKQQ